MEFEHLTDEIASAATRRPAPLRAHTFIQLKKSYSKPVWLQCADNNIYVVKGQHAGRSIFNDHTIAILGTAMGAPVASPALIEIPEELVQLEPQMSIIAPGLAHGTLWIKNTTDKQWVAYTDKSYNRPRFALLSVLYGWLIAGDKQLIYSNQEPNLVYSVDHGHFFPEGPNWTIDKLANCPQPQPHTELRKDCSLTDMEIDTAINALASISTADIIDSVAVPPDEWGVNQDERLALAHFLLSRRSQMI